MTYPSADEQHRRHPIEQPSESSRGGEDPIAFPMLVVYCLAMLATTAVYPLASLFVRVSNDFGEGWNAYWAQAIQLSQPLYSASRQFVANNYPPLSFYINAALGNAIGDNIFAGSLVAFASLVGVSMAISRIVNILGAPRRWALLSGAIFLLYNFVLLRQMVAINNPQWLGEFLGLAAVFPLIRRHPAQIMPRSVFLSASIMVAAGLVKHNQFALPAAITAWLFLFNRRAFAIWCLSGALLVGTASAILFAAYGRAIFLEVLLYQRTLDLLAFIHGLAKMAIFIPLSAVSIMAFRWQRNNPKIMLFLMYAAAGIVFGALQRIGSGVYINAYDDALIGLVTVCGALLGLETSKDGSSQAGARKRSALLLAILIPVMVSTPKRLVHTIADVRDLGRQEEIWRSMIADVKASRAPVLCELPAICYWAGKPFNLDFFAYGQKIRLGADSVPLLQMIRARAAGVVVVDRKPRARPEQRRLPSPFPELIEENYRVKAIAANHVATMVPR